MRSSVRKWGNSASVRIPGALMAAAGLTIDQAVELREDQGRIVIEPIRPATYSLDELLAQITDENLHEETDFGGPVGREVW